VPQAGLAGRLESGTQPTSANPAEDIVTTYRYDVAGNLTMVDNGIAPRWITYNTWNLQEDYVEPTTTVFPLPALRGRLSDETGAGAGTPSRTFGYDLAGFQTAVSQPGGTIGLVFDDRGLLAEVTGTNTAATYGYDGAGRLTSRTDGAGTATFTWTARGELDTATDPLTGTAVDYRWSDASQVDQVIYGTGGPVRTFGYDQFGRLDVDRLETAGASLVTETDYGYDVDGWRGTVSPPAPTRTPMTNATSCCRARRAPMRIRRGGRWRRWMMAPRPRHTRLMRLGA
jgi:YD repeat-containing protein